VRGFCSSNLQRNTGVKTVARRNFFYGQELVYLDKNLKKKAILVGFAKLHSIV
jgi:hypothetical protein